MCGRYASTTGAPDLSALFDAADSTGTELVPDYNVAPTDPAPIVRVRTSTGERVLSVARWGLVPAWVSDTRGAARRINARAETVASSKAYAASFARRRCLVPADGWYEWARPDPRTRQAYYLTRRDGGVLAFAGIWSVWGCGPDRLLTFSIVTAPALGELRRVHDRMPVVLPRQRWAEWLAGPAAGTRARAAGRMLAEVSTQITERLEIRPVGPDVGDVRKDGPHLLRPVSAQLPAQRLFDVVDLTRFSRGMP